MGTINQQIEALKFERQGYATFGKKDRVAAVDEQLEYWKGQRKKHGGETTTEQLTKLEKKQAIGEGVVTEAEAAREDPATDGLEASNARAAAHAEQSSDIVDIALTTEAEVVAADIPAQVAEEANALAAQHAAEPQPDSAEPNVVTEAEVVGTVTQRPARNASSEEWRAFEKSLPAPLGVGEDAGRDEIIAAYIDTYAPGKNASKEAWVTYAKEHGIDPGDLSRDEIRAAAVEAGWAKADEPPQAAEPKPKRNTVDKTPRTTR